MLKKTIKYEDFNGDEVEEELWFHLSKAELVELEMSHEGGFVESMQRIVDAQDNKAIITEFKKIILLSYGQKSMDGRRFIKNQPAREEFESSAAYSELFMELVTNTDSAIEFMNGIIPAGLAEDVADVVPIKPEAMHLTVDEAKKFRSDELMAKILSGEIVIIDADV